MTAKFVLVVCFKRDYVCHPIVVVCHKLIKGTMQLLSNFSLQSMHVDMRLASISHALFVRAMV